MPIRYELKDHIQPVENAPIAEGILDQREITIQSYQTTVPFDLAKLNAGLETAWLSPTTRLGIFSEISTTGDDGYAAVLGMQDHLTVRAYDYDERRPLWYSWKDVIVETASIRYYRGNDGKLWFITMGGGRRITEDKLNEFNSIFLKIPPTSVTRQVFDLAKLRDLCFNRFVDRLFMVRFKDHSGKEYESIDRAQFQSNDFIDPKAARLHEVRIDNQVKIESFEAEIQVSSKELTTPAAVRFLVRGLSGALRLRFPRLDLRNASQKPDKQAEAFYRIVNETRDSILDVDYYESNQNEWKVLYEQQDLFPVTVDVTACRNMLTKPEARETFLTGLNACRPKHEWHPPLLALNEVVMKDSARKHVATLLADKVVEKPLEAARLLDECRVDPGLWRIGGIAAAALSAKQHEIPATERASAEGAILAWAVEREKDGWDVDNDTGEVTVLHWRGSLDNLAIGLRMRVVANLIDRVHAKLTNSDGNVGVLLKKFNWCVEAARGMPSQHSDCPSSLRLIVEGKVPKSLAEGIKVLKTPVSDLAKLDECILSQFGLPLWPLLIAWRDNGKVMIRNTGIGSVQAMHIIGVDEIVGNGGADGLDLEPGKDGVFSIGDDTPSVLAGFTKYGKTLSYFLQVADSKPPAVGNGKPPMPTASGVEATLEAIHTGVQQLTSQTGSLTNVVENIGQNVGIVREHVRNVPIMQAELDEARNVPEALALEIQNRIADILTPAEQSIWRAVRTAGGSQKDALSSLQKTGTVKSAATLSRRVAQIDAKLRQNGLSPCNASGPAIRYTKSGGYENNEGKTMPEELSPVESDWAEDPSDRETTIRAYLSAPAADKALFHQTKPGIEEEAKKFTKRQPLKSNRKLLPD